MIIVEPGVTVDKKTDNPRNVAAILTYSVIHSKPKAWHAIPMGTGMKSQ